MSGLKLTVGETLLCYHIEALFTQKQLCFVVVHFDVAKTLITYQKLVL